MSCTDTHNTNTPRTHTHIRENTLSTIKAGARYAFKEKYTGFGQVQVVPMSKSEATEVAWAVGLETAVSPRSSCSALYRSDGTGAVLYEGQRDRFTGKLAYNFDLRNLGAPNSLQYDLEFAF